MFTNKYFLLTVTGILVTRIYPYFRLIALAFD